MHVLQTYFQRETEPETLFTFSPSIKTCLQRDLNWHFPLAASKLSKSKCDKCRAERDEWDKLQLPWQLSACVPPSATPQLYWLAVGDTISSIGQRPPFAPVSGSTCVLEINYSLVSILWVDEIRSKGEKLSPNHKHSSKCVPLLWKKVQIWYNK